MDYALETFAGNTFSALDSTPFEWNLVSDKDDGEDMPVDAHDILRQVMMDAHWWSHHARSKTVFFIANSFENLSYSRCIGVQYNAALQCTYTWDNLPNTSDISSSSISI